MLCTKLHSYSFCTYRHFYLQTEQNNIFRLKKLNEHKNTNDFVEKHGSMLIFNAKFFVFDLIMGNESTLVLLKKNTQINEY